MEIAFRAKRDVGKSIDDFKIEKVPTQCNARLPFASLCIESQYARLYIDGVTNRAWTFDILYSILDITVCTRNGVGAGEYRLTISDCRSIGTS